MANDKFRTTEAYSGQLNSTGTNKSECNGQSNGNQQNAKIQIHKYEL